MDNMMDKTFMGPMPMSYVQRFNEVITEMQNRNPESSSQVQHSPYYNPKDIIYQNDRLGTQENQSFNQ